MFGAVGPYSSAFSRAVAPHAELLGCVIRRPVGTGISYWLRHGWVVSERAGFACPLWAVGAYGEAPLYEKITKRGADLIVSCGFGRRLPAALAAGATRLGAVNLHPALLPRDRGPSPLFWCFRRSDAESGVSLHLLSEALDAGNVLAQRSVPVPRGVGGAEFFGELGRMAGELLLSALATGFGAGEAQGNELGEWARRPKHPDFEIVPSDWTAERLWHFVRGARFFGAFWAKLAGDIYYFEDALEPIVGLQVPGDFVIMTNEMLLRVSDGALRLRLRS